MGICAYRQSAVGAGSPQQSMSSKLFIPVAIGIIVIGGGFFLLQKSSAPAGSETPAPDIQTGAQRTVPNLSFKDYSGDTISLEDFAGKPLVVNAWAVWCPFCVKELLDFAEVQRELGDKIVIIAIDRGEPLATAKKFTDENGLTDDLIFLLDPDDSFYRAIGGFSMPETIFVDSEGVIKEHKRGPMDADEIRQRIQNIL